MDVQGRITDETLLDYLLERCDPQEAGAVASALQADAALGRRFDRLARIFQPLGTWQTPEPPARLVADILDAIPAPATLPFQPAAATLSAGSDAPVGRRPLLSFRELIALAACITLFFSVFVPTMNAARFNSRRKVCASNLASLYQGMTSYAASNAGMMPYSSPTTGRYWLAKPGEPRVSNRRHLYLVLRLHYVQQPKLFVCPDRQGSSPLDSACVASQDDFPNDRNCGYDLQHMDGPMPRNWTSIWRVSQPLVSDANPLFDGGVFHRGMDPESANSNSHRRAGQNVLRANGSVQWCRTPNCAVPGDNIWLAGSTLQYNGDEVPAAATDAFLVP